ncbi:hypothetical protein [Mesonia sp.]|uniref:hypothetical protein n=1 Tax=Mesonia sp. TaxID=1960830 RepID=UPI00176F62DF|nr:hypothetical protein [Mesonia sp.]HIB37598.1 hypothetical protein [Mesonia sp.]HIO27522.1 hypothetical protein [Flavobacteriaceae bacterium]
MTIQEILNISDEAYEFYVWQTWLGWAERFAKTEADLQSIIANSALFNWWAHEYKILEDDFKKKTAPYIGKVEPQELFRLYDQETEKIASYYSKTLINKSRKTKIINHLQLN